MKMLTKNFSEAEMACKHTGECHMNKDFMDLLQLLRDQYGEPMKITSGFRHHTHPEEIKKAKPGTGAHAQGRAADIACDRQQAFRLVRLAITIGFNGIGINMKPGRATGFVHVDNMPSRVDAPRPAMWGY